MKTETMFITGFCLCYILSNFFGGWMYTKNHYTSTDYIIKSNGKSRDIRESPHWDLVRIAWENDNHQLLLDLQGHGDREPSYNWLNDMDNSP